MRSVATFLTCFFASLVVSNPTQRDLARKEAPTGPPRNANHIFNAIHSSMRQWGSSLNHNGMSYFLATVPKGTRFFHGTHVSEPVIGMEWLAFEPEHALLFARPPDPRGPRRPPGEPKHPGQPPEEPNRHGGRNGEAHSPTLPLQGDTASGQTVLQNTKDFKRPKGPGWLHTYFTKKDLRLLYIDGMSAGKTDMGTQDSQDVILLNNTEGHAIFWDYERAEGLCKLVQERWNSRIDGFVRMEAGFEIILCSFAQNLETLRITRAAQRNPGREMGGNNDDSFAYFRAVAARYHDIGAGRVRLDYDNFVTAFDYPLGLFQAGELPRLNQSSPESASQVLTDLDMIIESEDNNKSSQNWQNVADMIVERYTSPLKYLASGSLHTIDMLQGELDRILRPFIDYEYRNSSVEIERCTTHFLPVDQTLSLAGRVVTFISQHICSTLHSAMNAEDYSDAIDSVQALIEYLDWTTWKTCPRCEYDEICFVSMWPKGSLEHHKIPTCLNATGLSFSNGYWGRF